jgi:mono/diheme cytochrome c family protein
MKTKELLQTLGFFFILISWTSAFSSQLSLNDKTLTIEEMKSKFEVKKIKVWEFHEEKNIEFLAIEANPVISHLFGSEKWLNEEELVITCLDGYEPTLPVEYFKKHKAYFALSIPSRKEFKITNKGQNETVDLGPLYLIWDNLHDRTVKTLGSPTWPYQVVKLRFAKFKDLFTKIAPSPLDSDDVKKGFLVFRSHCVSCHSLHGIGGQKRSEIADAVAGFDDKTMRTLIDNPRKIFPTGNMPPIHRNLPGRKAAIDQLIAYLRAQTQTPR